MKFTQTMLAAALLCAGPAMAASFHLIVPLAPSPTAHKPDPITQIKVALTTEGLYQATVGSPVTWDLTPGLLITDDENPQPSLAAYSIVAGSLLPGLALSTNGQITGVTESSGQASASIQVTYKGKKSRANLLAESAWLPVDFSNLMQGYSVPLSAISGSDYVATGSPYYWFSPFGSEGGSQSGTFEFRKLIDHQGADPVTLKIRGAVDDRSVQFSVDGTVLATDNWEYNELTDTKSFVLNPGKHVLGVQALNTQSTTDNNSKAGISLQVVHEDGTRFDSDGGWFSVPLADAKFAAQTLPNQYLWESGSVSLRNSLTLFEPSGSVDESLVTWSIVSGELPAGLSLNAKSGVISGVATEYVANKSFKVQVTYKNATAKQLFSLSTGYKIVDYSGLMAGFTAAAITQARHEAWVNTGSNWYWNTPNAQVSAAVGAVEFRKIVQNNTGVPINVQFAGAIDNSMGGMWINGTPVKYNPSWGFTGAEAADVFSLPPGQNVVSIIVSNAGTAPNPAGFSIVVRKSDGTRVDSEGGWYSR